MLQIAQVKPWIIDWIQGWCLGTYSMAAPMPVLGSWKGRRFGCPEPGAHGKTGFVQAKHLNETCNFMQFLSCWENLICKLRKSWLSETPWPSSTILASATRVFRSRSPSTIQWRKWVARDQRTNDASGNGGCAILAAVPSTGDLGSTPTKAARTAKTIRIHVLGQSGALTNVL